MVSGVALPFWRGPSEPTVASPFVPEGLMMKVQRDHADSDGKGIESLND